VSTSRHQSSRAPNQPSSKVAPQGGKGAGQNHGGNRPACSYNCGGGAVGKEAIVPWGFEQAARAERKQKAAANIAAQASAKAAKEYDPANVVAKKVPKLQAGDRAGQKKSAAGLPPAS